ncbi:MAG: anthranilate phosphoribosyltransferase [Pirellulaceae bacterium]|nr:MAG: anthranilate phosphoribosyltransferase [Pirellulaceae bacterium]GIW94267.1 MAG: anthranilate phosphoribosyltransferase [Pirellulaceae bacterium]
MELAEAVAILRQGKDLEFDQMQSAIDTLMRGGCDQQLAGQFLLALRAKGETITELAAAATALRRHMLRIETRRTDVLDTCGTGGDAQRTFNISTAAAIVAAAAGACVAKHGNRKVTSSSGSADVLTALGVRIDAPLSIVTRCLDELGLCFCYAQQLHPAMKNVATLRQSLGVPTIFNLLGPLANPAGAERQLLGAGRRDYHTRLAGALKLLGTRHAAVVTGEDGLDEVTISTLTEVTLVTPEAVSERFWAPEDFGIRRQPLDALRVETAEESAAVIRRVLAGEPGAARDIVVANAAAALWVAGRAADLQEAAHQAAEAIDSQKATRLLQALAHMTHRAS